MAIEVAVRFLRGTAGWSYRAVVGILIWRGVLCHPTLSFVPTNFDRPRVGCAHKVYVDYERSRTGISGAKWATAATSRSLSKRHPVTAREASATSAGTGTRYLRAARAFGPSPGRAGAPFRRVTPT